MNDATELLDLVDHHNQVIGTVTREDYYRQIAAYRRNHQYIRGVNAFILNSQGQLWVAIRSQSRAKWPGGYDFSMGEHVGAGESYEAAFIRGIREELGIDANTVTWRLLGQIGPAERSAVFCTGYLLLTDQTPAYNQEEFSGGHWLKPAELLRRLESGSPHKSDLLPFLQYFYVAFI